MAAYTTIDDPSAHFKVQLYTGDGSADHAITFDDTDTDMQPDFVWIKNRDATDNHCLFDALRGVTQVMFANADTAEATDADTLDAFQSDGFRVDADVKVNTSSEDYVAWCWKANGTGSSDTNGTINSTATSANTTAGFSIVTYTGTGANATVGHGLGIVPKFIIVLKRSATGDHRTGHIGYGGGDWNDACRLTTTNAVFDDDEVWNDTVPTTTLFSIGASGNTNTDGGTHCAYVWGNVQGFSRFSVYTGNHNANGPFVYTGFRPACIILKRTENTDVWHIVDNKRSGYNSSTPWLYPSTTAAEDASTQVEILSNGFKLRTTNTGVNADDEVYIYAAWAEAPFVNSSGVPNNAR